MQKCENSTHNMMKKKLFSMNIIRDDFSKFEDEGKFADWIAKKNIATFFIKLHQRERRVWRK